MEDQTENTLPAPEAEPGHDSPGEEFHAEQAVTGGGGAFFLLPLLISIFLFVGFSQEPYQHKDSKKRLVTSEAPDENENPVKINFSALLAAEEFSKNLRDTVYTNDDVWIEFRIDQQRIYLHYRDGRVVNYPVSSGVAGAHKSVGSRPGLFAIFHMNEAHKSSQFNSQLNYFMAFNMGSGFHGLPGTGYYVHLGVRPSSHGCVRMRNEDAKVVFKQCKIGTLVLAHKGHTNRVVAFAPVGFKDDAEYTKDDYMSMLAYNMGSIMEGKYFINPPKRFIMDGTVIPKSGVNVLSTEEVPVKQILPFAIARFYMKPDFLNNRYASADNIVESVNLTENFGIPPGDSLVTESRQIAVAPEMIKKYVHNPLGILPYFPPNN